MAGIVDLFHESVRLYSKGDIDGLLAMFSEDAVMTVPGARYTGKDQIREYWRQLYGAFPDGTTRLGRHAESGDMLFAEITATGTNTGELTMPDGATLPATGKISEMPGMIFVRVKDGKVAEESVYYDALSLLSQLGLMPG